MFDLLLLRFFAACADPDRPDANELGSIAGATRNAAARNAVRRRRDIISSLGRNGPRYPITVTILAPAFRGTTPAAMAGVRARPSRPKRDRRPASALRPRPPPAR